MDINKFSWVITNAKLDELYFHKANTFTDIKNCCSSVVYHAATISMSLMAPELPENKKAIDESMKHIESLTGSYKVLTEQIKLLSKRIAELKPIYVESGN